MTTNTDHTLHIKQMIWNVLYIGFEDDQFVTDVENAILNYEQQGGEVTGSEIDDIIAYYKNALAFILSRTGVCTDLQFERL